MLVFLILLIPFILALVSWFINKVSLLSAVNILGHFFLGCLGLTLAYGLANTRIPLDMHNFFYVDALSGFFIFVISIINFAAALYSKEYIEKDIEDGHILVKKAKVYYSLFNLFSFTMFFVTVVNNLGFVWVGIEMTTLASAFLVGFYNDKPSVEAAWKYIIICSVGIALALLGTILFYYAAHIQVGLKSLNWTDMLAIADKLDPKVLKIAFLFILVGYGTKAGIVPMHTWLPDAHSQALTPVSALLSGVLLKTAIYAILRFAIIVNKSCGSGFVTGLLLFFGLLSLAVSAAFILVQKDIKRLLAYSSIEHIGIICFGLGIFGPLGVYGALLHVFNHAMTKSLMFFGAGSIVKKYKTHNMHIIRGVLQALPFTGFFVILGVFALAGSVPFSIFMSEMMIVTAAFLKGSYTASVLFLLFIAIIFAALIHHFSKIIFGRKPENMAKSNESVSSKIAILFLFILICIMCFKVPHFLDRLLNPAVAIVIGA